MSLREGGRLLERAGTAAAVPAFATSLENGRVSGEHVDVLTRVFRNLEPAAQTKLSDQGERLVMLAENATSGRVRPLASATRRDGWRLTVTGLERLERQRRAVRLRVVGRQGNRDGSLVGDARPGDVGCVGGPPRGAGRSDVPRRSPRGLPDRSVGETVVPTRSRVVGTARRSRVPAPGDQRSSLSRTTPTRSPTVDRRWIGVSRASICLTSSWNSYVRRRACTRSRSATVSSSTPRGAWTWVARHGWPTAPNDERYAACTRPVLFRGVVSATRAPSCTT